MGFLRKVARDFSRDIQVIISGEGSSSKPKRQRYDPKKAKKRRGKFRKPFGGNFAKAMRKKYGDQATSLNTETQRDFADELRHLSVQALGRLLRRAYQNGDDTKALAIEREIDRRTKGKMLSRFSRQR